MLRRVLIAALLAGLLGAPPAHAQLKRSLLMPGVTYERQVQFTSHGPVAIHVLMAPKPGGPWSLKPVLSNNAIVGRERVTSMQRALASTATVAGVNGDLFAFADGRPSGILLQSGVLAHQPLPVRSSIGVTDDGTLRIQRVRMFGTWKGTGQRRPLTLNHPSAPNGVALYTPAWGPTTPAAAGVVEAVLQLSPTVPNVDLPGLSLQVGQTSGGTPIPRDGAVLVARGTSGAKLTAEAPPGTLVTIRLLLDPDWTGIVDAIGGGPVLVREGKLVFRHFEGFTTGQLARNPRTGVGQLADGRIVLVVVDGRQPGYSLGMTNFELAQTLFRLGAVTGSGLDAGGSSTLAFDGTLLNRPSDPGGERAVSEGLFVLYTGVHAPPPAYEVLSPNGDTVAEAQEVAYKLVQPSTVTAALVGPDGVARTLESGSTKEPGLYRFIWPGTTPEGVPEPEGRWRFTVTAIDAQGQTTSADRLFTLNRTLASLALAPTFFRVWPGGPSLQATFTLARPATVQARVETPSGAVVAVAARASLAAGPQALKWNGMIRRRVAHSGRYVLRVVAVNELGSADLTQPFTVRRVAAPAQSGARPRR